MNIGLFASAVLCITVSRKYVRGEFSTLGRHCLQCVLWPDKNFSIPPGPKVSPVMATVSVSVAMPSPSVMIC